jgi:hypothetical protein
MHLFSALRGMKIHLLYGVAGIILIILLLGSFIAPRFTAAQSRKPAPSEKRFEGALNELGKDYIVIDGKKYKVSKDLKIRDQKGKYTTFILEDLRFANRLFITLQDNIVIEIQIINFKS